MSTIMDGLSLGAIYALIALGYTMVYGIAKMLNFAHGDIIMVGAYAILTSLQLTGNPYLAVVVSILVCTASGVIIERLAYKPLRGASPLAVLITAIGVSFFLQAVAQLIFGSKSQSISLPNYGKITIASVEINLSTILTLVIDIAKQFISVLIGIVLWGEVGAYLAGLFCMIGHIAPVFFKFKGGKGVLTAAVMILMIDYQVFLIAFAIFALVVLISRYVSLGSVIAGFALPGIVWLLSAIRGRPAHPFALFFAVLIGLMLILMHRSNIKRLYEGNENKLSFKKKKKPEEDTNSSGEEKSGKEKKKK